MTAAATQLTPLQSAALAAVLEPDAAIPAIARRLNLTLESLLDLMDSPAVRSLLDRILALETLRRKITAAGPISAALRTLTALLNRPDAHPVEARRAATTILRTATSALSSEPRHTPADPPQATQVRAPRPAPLSPAAPEEAPAPPSAHARPEPARSEPQTLPIPASLPPLPEVRPLIVEPPGLSPFRPRFGDPASRTARLAVAAGTAARPP